MKPLHLKRLKKLLDHMEKGKLSVDKFDFNEFRGTNRCGSVGCMAGELPFVFPGEWVMKGWAPYVESAPGDFKTSCLRFFGLSGDESRALFIPNAQYRSDVGLPELMASATRAQVAANLRKFIKMKESTKE